MLPWLVAHPLLSRLLVFVAALCVAWLINLAIITQAFHKRPIGAWNPPRNNRSRVWLDWLPVIGWWRMRRELRDDPKDRQWLRPLLIELLFPLAMVWLYDAHVSGKLLPIERMAMTLQAELHSLFAAQFVLISLMAIATFIDFDEQLIPDTITIPGTIFGLVGSATFLSWFPLIPFARTMMEMDAASRNAWPAWLNGPWGLALGLLITSVWCFALLDRVWITRRGWIRAPRYFIAVIFRTRWWMVVLCLWIVIVVGLFVAWSMPIIRWQYLLSALFGLAFAGGITWAVRIAAALALRVEALGFGDVTLMAMIGTFIGWQPSLLVFFVAPLIAVLIFALRYFLFGSGEGPYGPYLCIATLVVILFWDRFEKSYAAPILELPPWVTFLILGLAVVMLGAMLWVYRLIKGTAHGLRPRAG